MKGFTLIELMIVISIIAVLSAIMIPNFIRARSTAKFSACQENFHTLATGLEEYANENGSKYPNALAVVVPSYTKVIPTCPAAASDTYSSGYAVTSNPDQYTLVCVGQYHGGIGVNYPQYTNSSGLIPGR
jgi:prepilin-type N-terminal cleavage/methylation domain-containing protein